MASQWYGYSSGAWKSPGRVDIAAVGTENRIDPATTAGIQPYGQSSGWALTDSEEFSGSINILDANLGFVKFRSDGPKWATWYPDWQMFWDDNPTYGNRTNTDQSSCYKTDHVAISGGSLILTCENTSYGSGKPYTAGMITTIPSERSYTHGAFEIRSRIIGGEGDQGRWPAFWMTSAATNTWTEEIDIWEEFGSHYESNIYASAVGWWNGAQQTQDTSWHTYSCIWTAAGVYFYRDGTQTGFTTNGTYIPDNALYLIVNSGARIPANPTFVQQVVEVDYVRMWTAA